MIQLFEYKESPIQFEVINGQVMANATLMCKAFGKRPVDWLKLESTKEYIEALKRNSITGKNGKSDNEDVTNVRKNHISDNQIVTIKQGSVINGGGTWIDQHLIIPLTRWLDVDFSIWCDIRVAELLRTGVATVDGKFAQMMDSMAAMIETMRMGMESLVAMVSTVKAEVEKKPRKVAEKAAIIEKQTIGIIDARHRKYTIVERIGGQIRCINIEDKDWFSMADVLIIIKCRTSPFQYAKALNRNGKVNAAKIWLFGHSREQWFVTEEGLNLLMSKQ